MSSFIFICLLPQVSECSSTKSLLCIAISLLGRVQVGVVKCPSGGKGGGNNQHEWPLSPRRSHIAIVACDYLIHYCSVTKVVQWCFFMWNDFNWTITFKTEFFKWLHKIQINWYRLPALNVYNNVRIYVAEMKAVLNEWWREVEKLTIVTNRSKRIINTEVQYINQNYIYYLCMKWSIYESEWTARKATLSDFMEIFLFEMLSQIKLKSSKFHGNVGN